MSQHLSLVRGGQGSVLTRKHDREDARRLLGVGRVFRPELTAQVVIVDSPEERLAGDFEATEVVLAVRVIVIVEVREVPNLEQYFGSHSDRQVCDPRAQSDTPADERCAKVVVENANAM